MKNKIGKVRTWMIPAVLTFFTFTVFKFFCFVGYVPTSSMEPTLKTGSYIIGTRLFDDLQKGDIVVFKKDGLLLVKRIYGCPGDVIDRSELRYMKDTPIPVFEEQVIIVPENHYFLLGDNSADSWDSRYWEEPFVGIQNVVAKLYKN